MPTLFDPLKVGDLTLRNRIVMAPRGTSAPFRRDCVDRPAETADRGGDDVRPAWGLSGS